MTRDSDFKALVRARMRETGQTYTAARADLAPPLTRPYDVPEASTALPPGWEEAQREQARVVGRFVQDGRLVVWPARRKARAAVVLHLVGLFEVGRDYAEREVNETLGAFHADHAFWRRELVDYGYLRRADGIYRLTDVVPERAAWMAQEIPAWEALWLPRHLAGR